MKKPLPFGKFLLLDRINVGGMAEVFLAKAFGVEGFQRILAIKKIIPTMVEDQEFITMFIDEARIAVQLNHANIVQIHELGKFEEHYYIAMEYVSGRDLRFMLDAAKKKKKLLPVGLSVFLAQAVCQGLDYAHRKKDAQGRDMNIVHRDVSPQNVLVSYEGDVKVIDFGIAKAQNRSQKTQAGILKGKFGYMSPEQVRGMPVDRRSDIFALGVILYEMLTGERLFVGESDFSTLEKVRNAEVLPPREFNEAIPEALEAIVMKSLAREPETRYQWAAEMGEDLMRFLVQGSAVYGQKQLAQHMKAEFAHELERENERMARFASLEAEEGTPVSPMPPPSEVPSNPPPGAKIRASQTLRDLDAILADPKAEEEEAPAPSEKTQLFNPGLEGLGHPAAPAPPQLQPSAGGAGIRSAATEAMEIPAVDGPVSTVIDMPAVSLPAAEGKTVIKAEPSNPRSTLAVARADRAAPATVLRPAPVARGSSLPPAVRIVPAREAPTGVGGRKPLTPMVMALAVGAGAGLLLLALIVFWYRGSAADTGTLIISPTPSSGAVLAVDGRPAAEEGHHTFIARGLVPGDHVIEGRNQFGLKVLKVVVQAGATRTVPLAMAEPPPAAPAPTAPSGPPTAAATPTPPVPSPGAAPPAPKLGLDLSAPPKAPAVEVHVTLNSTPPDAELFVDGQSVGPAPYVLTSSDPNHRFHLKAVAPGRRPAEKTARFAADQEVTLVLREEHGPAAGGGAVSRRHRGGPAGTLIISSRPVAKVFIDGRSTERYTPVPPGSPLEIPSGDHLIHLESDDGRKADREVSIQPHTLTKLLGVTLN
ncbi:MAG: protein kinase domain-containing protein [Myxococcales bacterium]